MTIPALHGSIADVAASEERLVNLWPSHHLVLVGDWLCRFAGGYSGRANSATLVRPGETLDRDMISHIERLYEEAGLRSSFRLTPLAGGGMRHTLEALGYEPEDGSIGMIMPAKPLPIAPLLQLDETPTPAWLEGACRWQTGAKRDVGALKGIVSKIRLPARFATLFCDGAPSAYGFIALDRGMAEFGSVMVDPEKRGKGLGRDLVGGMIGWAQQAGAERIFLQVAIENAVALGLYRSFGFEDCYSAAYWRRA